MCLPMRILLVEDNLLLRHHLSVQLQELGHLIDTAQDAKEADYYCQEHELDLAIVDLGLPDEDGISLIRRWRERRVTFPIMILTAREAWEEKVRGLEAGADDYLTKPFQMEELVARINALVRRASGLASSHVQMGPFQLDLSRKELKVDGEVARLTAFEYQILEYLMRRAGEVVSKETLMYQLYADAELRETHTIDVLMGRLRRKLQQDRFADPIHTVRGQGYRFEIV